MITQFFLISSILLGVAALEASSSHHRRALEASSSRESFKSSQCFDIQILSPKRLQQKFIVYVETKHVD
ncbi:hypothetical protein D918_03856 [Trichuris suis]|nr:hypothetical protein D918_03856 [Trichuris suis]